MKTTFLALMMAACAFAQKPPKPPKNGLYANFKTEFGDIKAILFEKDTPQAVGLFIRLAQGQQDFRDVDGKIVKRRFYDNTTFFRIVPESAVQAGSPDGTNTYNCGLRLKDETLPGIRFQAGSLAIANAGPDTGGCQFFITIAAMSSWNMKYTVFGQVVEGLDVVEKIARVPARDEHPLNPPKLIGVIVQRIGPPPVQKPKK
jgi:cyclophilin family peptidyl-prolyl cis-trans isomerase